MNRRQFVLQTGISFAALTLLQQNLLANFIQDPWKIKMLTKNLGIFTEKGGTIIFLLSESGIVVVDSEFPEQSGHLITELKKQSTQPFKLLINTHHHGDHTGGNIAFKELNPRVLAHANSLVNQKASAEKQNTVDKQLFPNDTYTDKRTESIDKEKISLYYFGAGHTNGDSLIHFEQANVVHMGDLLFNRRHPFVDRSAGASIKSWVTVLEKAQKQFDRKTTFVYGHSAEGYEVTGTSEDLKLFAEYLTQLLAFTDTAIKAGKTKEEFIKTTELPFKTTWKGDGLGRPLQAAYEELTSGS